MTLEKLTQENQGALIALMREFYHSPAVLAPVPDAHFEATCAEILSGSPFAAAFLVREADENAGYAQFSFTYSNEAGGMVVWIEELYIRPAFQNRGLGRACLEQIRARYPRAARFRLEVEPENEAARRLYARLGYVSLPYAQMIREE